MTRIDRNSANLRLRDRTKCLEKRLFAATNDTAIDGIAHRLLSCYHSQLLLFSHSKNNFSTTLTPTEKPRYTYCRVFFVDFCIYSKTINIIRNFFSILDMCKSGPPVPSCKYRCSRPAGSRYRFASSVLAGLPGCRLTVSFYKKNYIRIAGWWQSKGFNNLNKIKRLSMTNFWVKISYQR